MIALSKRKKSLLFWLVGDSSSVPVFTWRVKDFGSGAATNFLDDRVHLIANESTGSIAGTAE